MLLFAIIVLIIGFIILYKASGSSSSGSNAASRLRSMNEREVAEALHSSRVRMADRYSTMPTDVHDQVEILAQIIYVVYKEDPSACYSNPYGYLNLNSSGTGTLEFGYNWDYGLAEQHVRNNFPALDPRITFRNGSEMYYQANSLDHIEWIVDSITNAYNPDLVILTLQNECPGLQITQREVTQSGIRLSFKYQ